MKKPLIITIAILILLLALGSWLYLFFFGTPQNSSEFFTDLGITPDTQVVNPVNNPNEQTDFAQLNTDSQALTQLTLRPVAGYIALDNTVRYAERGTGHIYEINLETGTEERLSNTTIPQVVDATFNVTGQHVVFTAEGGPEGNTVAAELLLEGGSLATNNLPPRARDITFTSTSTVMYTLSNEAGTTGYEYDVRGNTQRTVFTTPFRAVTMHAHQDEIFIFNRHAPELEGTIYAITGNTFSPVGSSQFGLTTLLNTNWQAVSFVSENLFFSRSIDRDTSQIFDLPVSVIPEKCVWSLTEKLLCGAPLETVAYTYQRDWYQGVIRSDDALWEIDPALETATLLVYPTTEVGRQIDLINLQNNARKTFFINRLDDTLWVYDESIN